MRTTSSASPPFAALDVLTHVWLHQAFSENSGAYRFRRGCKRLNCASWRPWPRKNGQPATANDNNAAVALAAA